MIFRDVREALRFYRNDTWNLFIPVMIRKVKICTSAQVFHCKMLDVGKNAFGFSDLCIITLTQHHMRSMNRNQRERKKERKKTILKVN